MGDRLRTRNKTKNLYKSIIKKCLSKPEQLLVSEWAEKYRILDETSAIPGRWSNNMTPYLIEIMDKFNDPYVRYIIFVKPSQVGGTEAMINILGWIVSQNPSPTMLVYPDDEIAKDISKDKLKPAFIKSPILKDRFLENMSKERALKFKGMTMYINGAGSPTKLASKAIKYLAFDEIDKMGGATAKEASPYSLATERTKTFKYTKKIYACSTPTLKTNYIWKLHEEAEEVKHYFVPCPHCNEFIEIKWKQVKIVEDTEKKMTVAERAKTAKYVCQECGCIIENKDKPAMLREGEWRTVEKRCEGKAESVSYWINSLYSVFVSFEDAVKEFLSSKDDPEKLQNFINSWLAEPWEDTKLKTTSDLVMERQTDIEEFIVPEWAKFLTGGIDVQETSLYWTIRAWGDNITSQNICHGQAFSFAEVERVMNLQYCKEKGEKMTVELALIDSGDQTDTVYDFCANNSDWVVPCKGTDENLQHFRISKVNKVTSQAYGMRLILVTSGKYKDMIAARLNRKNGPGSWQVYKGCDLDYADQVTSEQKVIDKNSRKNSQGKKRMIWKVKTSHADNHYLDAEVYAFAAADMLGVRTLHLENVENIKTVEDNTVEKEEQWIQQNESWI